MSIIIEEKGVDDVAGSDDRDSLGGRDGGDLMKRPVPPAPSSPPEISPSEIPREFIEVSLPSRFVPYEEKRVWFRPLQVGDLKKLARAGATGLLSDYTDALRSCVRGLEVENMTVGDYQYLNYWLRINSYPNHPYVIKWVSKYGNENEHHINETNLDINELNSDFNLASWNERGLDLPRIKTITELQELSTDEDDAARLFELDRAQYIAGSSMTERLDNLSKASLETLTLIPEFTRDSEHGVNESVTVRDRNFELEAWRTRLRERIDTFTSILGQHQLAENERGIQLTMDTLEELERELTLYTKGGMTAPEAETIFPEMEPSDLLAAVYGGEHPGAD